MLVVAEDAEYLLKLVTPGGAVERIIEQPIPPRKGAQKDKDAYAKVERAALSFIERAEFGVEHVTVKRLPATWR